MKQDKQDNTPQGTASNSEGPQCHLQKKAGHSELEEQAQAGSQQAVHAM